MKKVGITLCCLFFAAGVVLAGGPPAHAGPKKSGATFQVVDSSDQFVGYYFGAGTPLLREVNGEWLAFNWSPFSQTMEPVPAGFIHFESTDCSGAGLVASEAPTLERYTYRLPGDTRLWVATGEPVVRSLRSWMINGTCLSLNRDVSVRELSVGFDTADWVPPFRLVLE